MWQVITDHPVALDSPDHLHPYGTLNDNSGNLEFVCKLKELGIASVLDLGCAGGLFVHQCLQMGIEAIGLEGSDFNEKRSRNEWAHIPFNLFTCDISRPFVIRDSHTGDNMRFDCITAWEVLEHINELGLDNLFRSLSRQSSTGTLFCCSITSTPSPYDGVDLHQTQKPAEWWDAFFRGHRWSCDTEKEQLFSSCWVRTGSFQRVYVKV